MYGQKEEKMTTHKQAGTLKKELTSVIMLVITLSFGLCLSGETSGYIKEGLRLAIECVIPTSLPFMIISDAYVCYGRPENIKLLKKAFQALFCLPPCGIAAFICGNVCGFPIGAKMVADSYAKGMLSRDDSERLIALSNNPSCAFIVGGIGLGIYNDLRTGIILLTAVYLSTFLSGVLTKPNTRNFHFNCDNTKQNYDFVSSVKNAGVTSISIISFISIFSAINGIIRKRIKSAYILCLIFAFSEVTNAIKFFADTSYFSIHSALTLTAFSLGFGGVCVGMQSAVFTTPYGIKMRKYYLIKLLNAILSASIFSFLYIIK